MNVYLAIGAVITVYFLFLFWLFKQTPPDLKVRDLKIPKRKFVLMVLQWCEENLQEPKNRYDLILRYYQNRKFLGQFQSYNNQIIIYLNPDLQLDDLVDTVIHEYTHLLQFSKTSTEQEYNKKLVEVGYWENPYEVEARKTAAKNKKVCLDWIFSNFEPC